MSSLAAAVTIAMKAVEPMALSTFIVRIDLRFSGISRLMVFRSLIRQPPFLPEAR
jgi:hypothetical protein